MTTKKIALLGMLIALCVVGRIAFSSVPNVQPVTAIIIICAFWMGPLAGVILAVGTTFATNLVLGSGMWTITQIFAWSVIGLLSGAIGIWFKKIPVFLLSLYAGLCGLFFGLVFSIQNMVVGGVPFLPYYLAGLPFDINHAVGNVVFFIVLYPILSKLLNEKASFIVKRKNDLTEYQVNSMYKK
ncbi:metal ABC transporter permease [Bacillus sp. LL01]|uniref:ECF transporter S component n=1 Tax=Bacillus sp. LL01 TaxID=1665556 RepID=UPI00064CEB8C|nr:ECF transporter S component [Bacillus sp. LL01]KMJ59796.1 metal ABC transporter permease [Bacillus sp. LL01]